MFYIIERKDQLDQLGPFKDCFVKFIQGNDNYHPKLSPLSLIYVRDTSEHKGYILCLNHNESFSLETKDVFDWLLNKTERLFVLNKKEALYSFPHEHKLFDIEFLKIPDLTEALNIPAIKYYYQHHAALPNVNYLIPISKHYEENENIFSVILPIIRSYRANNAVYAFNNGPLTRVFHEIESQGIQVDKKCFVDCYGEELKYPQFNLSKSKIYSQYNLQTLTGRPSNTYNSINFAALNKTSGERLCYKPANDTFVEFDMQGYHPRLIAELIGFEFNDKNTYETLGELLGVSTQEAKELTFKQLYGGVWDEYRNKPFFKDIVALTDGIWEEYQYGGRYSTENRIFISDREMTQSKLLNYIVQSMETSTNVKMLVDILEYLKDKQTKIVLYTYDAFLFDYAESDGKQTLIDIKQLIKYPVNIKMGKSYHELNKI
jgi:hypothetical protein